MSDSTFQVIALAIYFIAMIVIGLWANSKNNDLDDYVLGGRQLSPTVAALSAGAADMSGWLLMGLPGAVYLAGLSKSWIAIGLTIGAWVNWKFIAPPSAQLHRSRWRCRDRPGVPQQPTAR